MSKPIARTIIVTGGSRGLGRAIAFRFGSAGDQVAIVYHTGKEDAEAVASGIRGSGGNAVAIAADVRNRSAVERMAATVLEKWGSIDVLVNNAAIARDSPAIRMSEQDWDDVLETDLKGPFLCIREVTRVMMKQRSGQIINISSITAVQGREGQANYSAAKAGLIGMTKAAAKEIGRFDIKVNAVLPGYLDTAMGRTVSNHRAERIIGENALGRANDPDEVAEFIYRLSLTNNISGQVFNLDSRVL
jgi:3-oxoacyl-[acyl-carrier protein] reductase